MVDASESAPEGPRGPGDAPEASGTSELGCDAALALVRRFVSGDEDVAERTRLRAHLARCVACREQYRAEVVLLAQLARGGERPLESVRRMEERASRVVGARWARKRSGLVRLVLPSFGLLALYLIADWKHGVAPASVESVAGRVQVGETSLEASEEPRALPFRSICATDERSRAVLTLGESRVVLEPDTAVCFERGEVLRVRLFFGRLLVDGPVVVTSAAGVVEARTGSGVVELAGTALDAACASGEWSVADPAGSRAIGAGERARVLAGLASH